MVVRTFVLGSLAATLIASAILALIINWLSPSQGGFVGYALFFLALFLAVGALASLVGYGLRRIVLPRQLPAYSARNAIRQGILLAAFTDLLLLLQLLRLARWWLAVLLLLMMCFSEFIFLSYDRSANRSAKSES